MRRLSPAGQRAGPAALRKHSPCAQRLWWRPVSSGLHPPRSAPKTRPGPTRALAASRAAVSRPSPPDSRPQRAARGRRSPADPANPYGRQRPRAGPQLVCPATPPLREPASVSDGGVRRAPAPPRAARSAGAGAGGPAARPRVGGHRVGPLEPRPGAPVSWAERASILASLRRSSCSIFFTCPPTPPRRPPPLHTVSRARRSRAPVGPSGGVVANPAGGGPGAGRRGAADRPAARRWAARRRRALLAPLVPLSLSVSPQSAHATHAAT